MNNSFLESLKVDKNENNSQRFTAKKGSLKKALLRGGATALAALTIAGFVGCTKNHSTPEQTTTSSITQSVTENDRYANITNSDSMLKDLKQRYIEAYNKENDTNFSPSDISIVTSPTDYLYETKDGKLVTHGSHPYETEDELAKYGDFHKIGSAYNIDLYQVILKSNKSALETHTKFFSRDGKYIDSPVLSGNNLDELLENLNSKESIDILGKYINAFDAMTNNNKSEYIAAIEKAEKNEKTKYIAIDD